MNLNGFNRIAFIYDFLSRLVFGESIIESQTYFLNKIEDKSRVLILGGGSGWLLAELLTMKPRCEIWYIEASSIMIDMSSNKIGGSSQVHFVHGTELDIPRSIAFDVVITNFYLDLFTEQQLRDTIRIIKQALRPGATWIATDFIGGNKWWQGLTLRAMYIFFRMTCNIRSQKLPQWETALGEFANRRIEAKSFYKDFIKTTCYQY